MAYSNKLIVPYYDCDENGNMRIGAAIRAMQQVAGDHLDFLDLPYEKLHEQHMVFLLSKTILKVHRMPRAQEEITITTLPSFTKGAKFPRDMVLFGEHQERLVTILTIWMLVDPETRKILRPTAFPYELPYEESITQGYVEDAKFPKIAEDLEPTLTMEIPVRYSYIDNNGHVNNSIYIDLACDTIPYDLLVTQGIDTLMIAYQSEAKPHDTIIVKSYHQSENEYHVIGTKSDGGPCFETYITLKDKI